MYEVISELADRICAWFTHHKVTLSLSRALLEQQIITYIEMRRYMGAYDISAPQHRRSLPQGWTAMEERIWMDWISYAFDLEEWNKAVIGFVFGTEDYEWEARSPGWRQELFSCVPYWIERSMDRFMEIDVRQLEESQITVTEIDPRKAVIDPYLLDHGKRGRKIKGVRMFE